MSTISNGESGASVRTKLNASLVITDAISDTASGVIISDTERTKLGTIEGGADVTDSINVASSGALMDADFRQSTGSLFKDKYIHNTQEDFHLYRFNRWRCCLEGCRIY